MKLNVEEVYYGTDIEKRSFAFNLTSKGICLFLLPIGICALAVIITADLFLKAGSALATDFTGTNLTGAHMTNMDLRAADLTDADLTNADLSRSDLRGAKITQAQLN